MQGLADGYFVLPYTINEYLSDDIKTGKVSTDTKEFKEAEKSVADKIDALIKYKWVEICRLFSQKTWKNYVE